MDERFQAYWDKLPQHQTNALVADTLTMRIGVPHTGGKLAFNAFNRNYPVMVSASAFWNAAKREFRVPVATDLQDCDIALDSGGYSAILGWQSKGPQLGMAAVFPWTCAQYVQLAMEVQPAWWSQPDLCCEQSVAKDQDAVDYRVRATATLLEATLRQVFQFQCDLADSGLSDRAIANILKPPVPVLQGRTWQDYVQSLDLMQQVWSRWEPWLAQPTLIGVGSVCRRELHDPNSGLYAILDRLEPYLPPGMRLHLFGVKGAALERVRMLPYVASADSMAYDFSARVKAREAGLSNTLAHRCAEMDRWMDGASRRASAKIGDQFRLGFNG